MARQGKARVLTPNEFKRAIKAASLSRHAKRNSAILYLQFSMGLRACEIRRLRLGDVLAPDGALLEEINLLNTMTKGKKQRHAYLVNKKARHVLIDYINERREKAKKKKRDLVLTEPLFISQKGGQFLPSNIVYLICSIYKTAGLVGAKSHSGRRTAITHWLDSGKDIKAIADIVGHASITTTAGYHESNPSRLKKIAQDAIF